MVSIYLINHTEIYNPHDLICGQAELPLTENFTISFDWINSQLPKEEQGIPCFSATCRRCQKLAAYLQPGFVNAPEINDRSYGDWELKSAQEISKISYQRWQNNVVGFRPKNGESLEDVCSRAKIWVEKIRTEALGTHVLISGSDYIKAFVCIALNLPESHILQLSLNCGSISKVSFCPRDDRFLLDLWNHTPGI